MSVHNQMIPELHSESGLNSLPSCSESFSEVLLPPAVSQLHNNENIDELVREPSPCPGTKPSQYNNRNNESSLTRNRNSNIHDDFVEDKLNELRAIFYNAECTIEVKDELLKWMKDLDPATQNALPTCSKTLQPKIIPHSIDPLPGEAHLVYFRISTVLNHSAVDLFDPNCIELLLTANIDGLPIFKSS